MDEFELIIKKISIDDYWLSLKHVKSEKAMIMHLDFDEIVIIRNHLDSLIKEKID